MLWKNIPPVVLMAVDFQPIVFLYLKCEDLLVLHHILVEHEDLSLS